MKIREQQISLLRKLLWVHERIRYEEHRTWLKCPHWLAYKLALAWWISVYEERGENMSSSIVITYGIELLGGSLCKNVWHMIVTKVKTTSWQYIYTRGNQFSYITDNHWNLLFTFKFIFVSTFLIFAALFISTYQVLLLAPLWEII